MRRHMVLVLLIVMMSESPCAGQQEYDAEQQLEAVIADAWDFRLRHQPLFATSVGEHKYNDRLPVVTLEAIAQQTEASKRFLAKLKQIDRQKLSKSARLNFDLFALNLRNQIADARFNSELIPITNRSGFHISFPELRNRMPFNSTADYENYISRLEQFKRYAQGHIALMRIGIERGYTLPLEVLANYRNPIEPHVVNDPKSSLFFEPLKNIPSSIPSDRHADLRRAALTAIENSVVPGYELFLEFMEKEYVPNARNTIGASTLPEGREYYRHCVQKFTTLPISPDEVHTIGMNEVARIRKEMEAIIEKVGFDGDFASFVNSLRSNKRFHPQSAEHLMKEVSFVLKKMDGKLPLLFKTLPRTPYGIKKIPDYIAPNTTTAYYMPPPGDGSLAGFYYVNTFDLKSRPLYEVEALSLHEAVPGHHLQIALQQEMSDMPHFRRFSRFTAFIEGWALYSERLGLEVGFYQDPYSDFGRLTYEMWRACRLVVDTGMHYFGWSRQKAIDFMADNTALSLLNIKAEVDRYISWPGQALAYKMGELKIRELRELAEQRLGRKFDIRDFHEVVLSEGGIPLEILESRVKNWIDQEST